MCCSSSLRPTTTNISFEAKVQKGPGKRSRSSIQPSQVCGENLVKEESCMFTYLGLWIKGNGSLSFRNFSFGYYAVL